MLTATAIAAGVLYSLLTTPHQEIRCSWYGEAFAGRPTASGHPFDPKAYTVAHRTLPLGSVLLLLTEYDTLLVQVTDRGPYATDSLGRAVFPLQPHPTRDMDVSMQVAKDMRFITQGVGTVQYRLIGRAPIGYMSSPLREGEEHGKRSAGATSAEKGTDSPEGLVTEMNSERESRVMLNGCGEWVVSGQRNRLGTGEAHHAFCPTTENLTPSGVRGCSDVMRGAFRLFVSSDANTSTTLTDVVYSTSTIAKLFLR